MNAGRGYALFAGVLWAVFSAHLGELVVSTGALAASPLTVTLLLAASLCCSLGYVCHRHPQVRPQASTFAAITDPLMAASLVVSLPVVIPSALWLLGVLAWWIASSWRLARRDLPLAAASGVMALLLAVGGRPLLMLVALTLLGAALHLWQKLGHLKPLYLTWSAPGRQHLLKACGPDHFEPFDRQIQKDILGILEHHGGVLVGPAACRFEVAEKGAMAAGHLETYLDSAQRRLVESGLPGLDPRVALSSYSPLA